MALISGFDPLQLPGCGHCGARVRLINPWSGKEYAGAPLGCCLVHTLHEVAALLLRLQDADLDSLARLPYEGDLQNNLVALQRLLSDTPSRGVAIREAKDKLPQFAAHQWAAVQAVMARGGAR